MYATVTLTGKISFGLEPAVGRAILTPTVNRVADMDGNVVIYGPITDTLDATGAFSIQAPATDDPNLNPQNFGYTLRFELERGTLPAIPEFGLPAAADPVDLTDILPEPQNPTYVPTLTGPPTELTVGTVTTGDPGTAAQVTITGEPPNQVIDFIIPKGLKGDTGDVNNHNHVIADITDFNPADYYTKAEMDPVLANATNKADQLKIDAEQSLRLWRLEAQVVGSAQDMSNWHGDAFLTNQDEINDTLNTPGIQIIRASSLEGGYAEQTEYKGVHFSPHTSNSSDYFLDGNVYTDPGVGGWGSNNIVYAQYVPEVGYLVIANQLYVSATGLPGSWVQKSSSMTGSAYINSSTNNLFFYSDGYLHWAANNNGTGVLQSTPMGAGSWTWTQHHSYGNGGFTGIIFDGTYYLLPTLSSAGVILRNTTLRTGTGWTEVYAFNSSQGSSINSLVWTGSRFLCVLNNGHAGYNANVGAPSTSWFNIATTAANRQGVGAIYGNGFNLLVTRDFLSGAWTLITHYSTNGVNWSSYNGPLPESGGTLRYAAGYFYVGANNNFKRTDNPVANANWTVYTATGLSNHVAWTIKETSQELVSSLTTDAYALPEVCNKVYILRSAALTNTVLSFDVSLNGGTTWDNVTTFDAVVTLSHSGNNLLVRPKFTKPNSAGTGKLFWFIVYAAPAA